MVHGRKENVIEMVTSRLHRLGYRPTSRLKFGRMEISTGTWKDRGQFMCDDIK
jgi:hypothetical protein